MHLKKLAIILVLLLSMPALAHPGHDHSHWMSEFLHVMFYLSSAGTAGVIAYTVLKRFFRQAK